MKKIYVLISVSYDWYRFERTEYASTKKSKLIEFVQNHSNKNQPVIEYELVAPDYEDPYQAEEISHWQIRSFEE